MSEKVKRICWFLIKLLGSAVAVYIVIQQIDLKDAVRLFVSQDLILVTAAFILYIFSKYITAERFRILLEHLNISLSVYENGKLYLLGMYYNIFLPGGIGGDAYKAYQLNRTFNKSYKDLIILTLLDRIGGVIAILFLLLACGIFLFSFYYSILCIISILLLGIVYYLVMKKYFSLYIPSFVISNFQSIMGQIIQVIGIIILLFSLGVKEMYLEYSFVFLVSSIVAALPFTIGGIGARELTFIYGASYLNLDSNLAITVSVIFYLITVLSSLIGAPYSFSELKLANKDSGRS